MNENLAHLRRTFRDVTSCSVATARPDDGPYVAARWFVWLDDAVWVSTRVGDPTWEHVGRDPRVAVLIARGREWIELAGVRIEGVAERMPAEHPDLREPMSAWHDKYRGVFGDGGFDRFAQTTPALGFLRVAPSRVDAWDHRTSG